MRFRGERDCIRGGHGDPQTSTQRRHPHGGLKAGWIPVAASLTHKSPGRPWVFQKLVRLGPRSKSSIEGAKRLPYDSDDEGNTPKNGVALKQWLAARAVLKDLCDRRGVKHELEQVDYETRCSIVRDLADIIAEVYQQ